jgi:hypothetical protein
MSLARPLLLPLMLELVLSMRGQAWWALQPMLLAAQPMLLALLHHQSGQGLWCPPLPWLRS